MWKDLFFTSYAVNFRELGWGGFTAGGFHLPVHHWIDLYIQKGALKGEE